jgi:kumamolisin
MATSSAHRLLQGSEHPQPKGFRKLQPTDGAQELTATLMLRRHQGHTPVKPEEVIARPSSRPHTRGLRKSAGARRRTRLTPLSISEAGLQVVDADAARRSVIVHGSADAIGKAFAV